MQLVIVILSLVMAVVYAAWRLSKTFGSSANPCCGCDCCSQDGEEREKECCERKKTAKNLDV